MAGGIDMNLSEPLQLNATTWKEKHITKWAQKDVSDWLNKISALKAYKHHFIQMNGAELTQLTDTTLAELIPNKTICKAFKRKIDQKKNEHVDEDSSNNYHDHEDTKTDRLIGLRNLGNTCYLNSTIQGLLSSKAFVQYFRHQSSDLCHIMDGASATLLQCWIDLCQQTAPQSSNRTTLSPYKFRNALSKIDPRWGNGGQDDSVFVLFNILQVLDEQIQEQYASNMNKYCKDVVIDNMENESDLIDYDEEHLMTQFLSIYNPQGNNIVRHVFDGILCEEAICGECQFCQKIYSPFRFIRLPLTSSIVTLRDVHIYIPQKLPNKPLIIDQCELLSYCSVDTLRHIIRQYVYTMATSSECKEPNPIQLHNIEIATLTASNSKNIDKMVKWMGESNTCNDLNNKTFAVVTFDDISYDDTQHVVLIHFTIKANKYAVRFEVEEVKQGTCITQERLVRSAGVDAQGLYPLIYLKNGFVDRKTRAVLVVWIDTEAFELARSHLDTIAKYKNDASVNTMENIIGYIESWNLIHMSEAKTIADYVFNVLNLEFGTAAQYNKNEEAFDHITDSLEEYLKSVVMDNQAFALLCKRCDGYSRISERRRTIVMAPKSLIIFINRCSGADTLYKLKQQIKYDLDGFIVEQSSGNERRVAYNLSGVINHSGSLRSGHYTANVRNIHDPQTWFYTSDSYTRQIKVTSVIDTDSMVLIYSK